MKFLHLSFHFEYAEVIEPILDRHEVRDYARYSMVVTVQPSGRLGNQGRHGGAEVMGV